MGSLIDTNVWSGIDSLRRRDAAQANRLEMRLADLYAKMSGRILPVSAAIAERWGRLNVPDPFPTVDGLLAATALEHDLVLVTRNVRDIERSGVRYFNPFEEPAA